MWICKNCKEKVDLDFDVCWNCGVQDLNKDLCSESENLIEFENENKELLDTEEPSGNKNMFWGAIWCVGGIIFTVSDTGYIWWGAILFGGIQFFQGLIQSSSSNKD